LESFFLCRFFLGGEIKGRFTEAFQVTFFRCAGRKTVFDYLVYPDGAELDKQRCPNIIPADSAGFSRLEHGNEPIPVRRARPPPPALVGNRPPGPQFMDEDDWEAFEREDEDWDEGKEGGGQAKSGEEMKDEEEPSEEGGQPAAEGKEGKEGKKAPVQVSEIESESESEGEEEEEGSGDEEAKAAKKKAKKKSKKPKREIVISSEESEQPKDFGFSGFSSEEE
jgi:hypothetical protein